MPARRQISEDIHQQAIQLCQKIKMGELRSRQRAGGVSPCIRLVSWNAIATTIKASSDRKSTK